jgi:hypothetical protein
MTSPRKKVTRRELREMREKEAWAGVLKGIEEKVNQEYGFQNSFPNGPTLAWVPMDERSRSEHDESKSPPCPFFIFHREGRRGERH